MIEFLRTTAGIGIAITNPTPAIDFNVIRFALSTEAGKFILAPFAICADEPTT
jgi:hypothetical protein